MERHQYPGKREYELCSWLSKVLNYQPAAQQQNEQNPSMQDNSVEGTTTFVTDSKVQEQVFNNVNVETGILPVRDQGIVDFLAKPQLLTHLTWTTSQVANNELYNYTIEDALTPGTGFDVWLDKIKGFNLVRGTAVLRFVLNAEPFHAGKLIASFIPVASQVTSIAWRKYCLNQKTQQPNVEMDCRDSVAIIKIPYIAPTDYYEVQEATIGWGQVCLSVLSPLRTGSSGSNNVKVSVFMHFEDFEMAAPIYPQSGASIPKIGGRAKGFTGSIQDKEASIMDTGTISRALMIGAQVASAVEDVPVLSTFAAPTTWVLRGMAHVASWFGWSKPELQATQDVVTRRFIPYMANSTGASTAPKMALLSDNQIDIMPFIAGNDRDEMSFSHLKSIKAYCDRFLWTTSNNENDTLYTKNMTSASLVEAISVVKGDGIYSLRSYPAFGYITQYFNYWRGGIKMHVKIAKTDFHSGRILVTYTPSTNPTSPSTAELSTYSLREIIDVRNKSEFVLDLPYLLNTPYIGRDESMGQVQIKVLNELRAPETVNTNIEFLVYFSACDDYELQVPTNIRDERDYKVTAPFYAQAGGVEPEPDQSIVENVIGSYAPPVASMTNARICMGECFSSIKQLLNRYTTIVTSGNVSTSTTGVVEIYPFSYGGRILESGIGGLFRQSDVSCDALSNFIGGYAFFRGSVRLEISQTANTNPALYGVAATTNRPTNSTPNSVFGAPNWATTSVGSINNPSTKVGTLGPIQHYDPSPFLEVSVPYQSRTHMTIVDPFDNIDATPTSYSAPNTMLDVGWPGADNYQVSFRRSTGDEFQLAYFLGFPPLLFSFSPE